MNDLGKTIKVTVLSVKGQITEQNCERLNQQLVKTIDMETAGLPTHTISFPVNGLGGCGFTKHQPIVTSFITWDIWTDWQGGYLFVVSCKDYEIEKIRELLKTGGIEITQVKTFMMGIEVP